MGTDAESNAALATLRDEILPATVGKVAGAEYAVAGVTAEITTAATHEDDGAARLRVRPDLRLPAPAGPFRSIVVALKAILLNLLSVGAAYGILVAVFQWGGARACSASSRRRDHPWLPMFLFVILFGLSMDYHVFVLSRVREAYDRGLSNDDAVAHGIKCTAGVVTERGGRDGRGFPRLRDPAACST